MCEEIESATFTNLLLLGLDPVLMERKHATTFHRRMFRKANAKGMEIVLHFLIQRGFDQQCAQELALVWPIFDKPSARGFRKLATSLLQGLQVRGGPLPRCLAPRTTPCTRPPAHALTTARTHHAHNTRTMHMHMQAPHTCGERGRAHTRARSRTHPRTLARTHARIHAPTHARTQPDAQRSCLLFSSTPRRPSLPCECALNRMLRGSSLLLCRGAYGKVTAASADLCFIH